MEQLCNTRTGALVCASGAVLSPSIHIPLDRELPNFYKHGNMLSLIRRLLGLFRPHNLSLKRFLAGPGYPQLHILSRLSNSAHSSSTSPNPSLLLTPLTDSL